MTAATVALSLAMAISGITGERGTATWYDDGPGLYAAVHSWHFGDTPYRVTVHYQGRQVVVTVRDFCACRAGLSHPRLIDLSPAAFAALSPDQSRAGRAEFLRRGVLEVVVTRELPDVPLPATDTGPAPAPDVHLWRPGLRPWVMAVPW